jgi:isochorismate hydrolase
MAKTFFNIRESNNTEEVVVEEVVELEELTAAEKKMINQMYDKKGNLTPLGKKVMDHGKAASKLSPKDLDKDAARRKEYRAFQKSKRNEEVDVEEAKKPAGKRLSPDQIRKALSSAKAKAKGKEKVSLKKAPWDK